MMSGGARSICCDRLVAVADRDDADVFVGEGQLDDAPNRQAVVREEQCCGIW